MGSHYHPITKDDFETSLMFPLGFTETADGLTAAYVRKLKGDYTIKVYSSISKETKTAVAKGETAIRVVVLRREDGQDKGTGFPWGFHHASGNGQKSALWAARTTTWLENTTKIIRQAVAAVFKAPGCHKCLSLCEPRQNKSDGTWFWGCNRWKTESCYGGGGVLDLAEWKAYLQTIKELPIQEFFAHDVVLGYWLRKVPAEVIEEPKVVALAPTTEEPATIEPTLPSAAVDPAQGYLLHGFVLNKEQFDVVSHGYGPLVVPAVAGSGKTRTMTIQIVEDVKTRGIHPGQIVAFSMTNKAVKELRGRLIGSLGYYQANQVNISTIHSFCWGWLKQLIPENSRYQTLLGKQCDSYLAKEGRISSAYDIIKIILKTGNLVKRDKVAGKWKEQPIADPQGRAIKFGPGLQLDKTESAPFVTAVSLLHAYCISPTAPDDEIREAVDRLKNKDVERYIPAVYRAYEQAKWTLNVIDFNDMITCFIKDVVEDEHKIAMLRNRFIRIISDEFQDSSRAQQRVALALAQQPDGSYGSITVCGDPRQALFSFSGAVPKTFLEFPSICNAKVISLKTNYRSSRLIVQMGQRISMKNAYGMDEEVFWVKPEEWCVKPVIAAYQSQKEEAESIAERIYRFWAESDHAPEFPFKDSAILCRTNAQTAPVQIALMTCGIPFVVPSKANFFETALVKKCVAYLKAVLSIQRGFPVSGEDIAECCDFPKRGLGEVFKSMIKNWQGDVIDGCRTLANKNWRYGQAEELADLLQAAAWEYQDRPNTLQAAWHTIVSSALSDYASDAASAEVVMEDEALVIFSEVVADFKWDTIDKFLDMASWSKKASFEEDREQNSLPNAVVLSTVHSAKGGEWDTVYGIGLSSSILPHFKAVELEDGLREERNIFYVLVTRAIRQLHLSWLWKYCKRDCDPSQFLREALVAGEGLEEYLEAANEYRD